MSRDHDCVLTDSEPGRQIMEAGLNGIEEGQSKINSKCNKNEIPEERDSCTTSR